MKMKIYRSISVLVGMICAFTTQCLASDPMQFLVPGKSWKFTEKIDHEYYMQPVYRDLTITVTDDEEIYCDKLCRKVEVQYSDSENKRCFLMWENEGVVYLAEPVLDQKFVTYYDFNIHIGDEIPCFSYYSEGDVYETNKKLKVTKEETIEVKGVKRKKLTLTYISDSEKSTQNTVVWVEGIGGMDITSGLVTKFYPEPTMEMPDRSITNYFMGCYQDGEEIFSRRDFGDMPEISNLKCLPEDDILFGYSDSGSIFGAYCISGETEYQGKTYRNVFRVNSVFDNPKANPVALLREEEGKVYMLKGSYENIFGRLHGWEYLSNWALIWQGERWQESYYDDAKECLIYDFNLSYGDIFNFGDDYGETRVSNIETVNFLGEDRIKITIDRASTYISGIGAIDGGTLAFPHQDKFLRCARASSYLPHLDFISDMEGNVIEGKQMQFTSKATREYRPMIVHGRRFRYNSQYYSGDAVFSIGEEVELFGKNYHKIHKIWYEGNINHNEIVAYMREEEGRVYCRLVSGWGIRTNPYECRFDYSIGEEFILYDMNAETGDQYYKTTISEHGTIKVYNQELKYQNKDESMILEGFGVVKGGFLIRPSNAYTMTGFYEIFNLLEVQDIDGNVIFTPNGLSGISTPEAETAGEAEYFTLQGVKSDGSQPGIYLRRKGNKVEKVIVK